jgi:hypothetical protein
MATSSLPEIRKLLTDALKPIPIEALFGTAPCRPLVSVHEDTSLAAYLSLLNERGIMSAPVYTTVGSRNVLMRFVSVFDVLRYAFRRSVETNTNIRGNQTENSLADVPVHSVKTISDPAPLPDFETLHENLCEPLRNLISTGSAQFTEPAMVVTSTDDLATLVSHFNLGIHRLLVLRPMIYISGDTGKTPYSLTKVSFPRDKRSLYSARKI